MRGLRSTLREHLYFIVVVTLLTLVMTWPTILNVFRTDVFWLPTGGSKDAYIAVWDVWYGERILSGQADRFYTDLMFYPAGLSLDYHPLPITNIVVAAILGKALPLAGAFSLGFLVSIFASALAAYIYMNWLFRDRRVALFGAVVFGISPHVLSHVNHPAVASVALLPLALYCFHRGMREDRARLVAIAGLLAGASSFVILYLYVCVLITLGLFVCAFALSRWRERRFWFLVSLLLLAVFASSIWRVFPLLTDSQARSEALEWYGGRESSMDVMSYLINKEHPALASGLLSLFQSPDDIGLSNSAYIGYLPLALIIFGLWRRDRRRRMLIWAVAVAVFVILELGSFVRFNGAAYSEILLPRYYLDRLFPSVFRSFFHADMFHIGMLLPITALSCNGLAALMKRWPALAWRWLVLVMLFVVAFEYYMPITANPIPLAQFDFLKWLAEDAEGEDPRLINLPMGRNNSKRYNLYQALSGFPQAEGAISRTPESAFNFIRANPILEAWHDNSPVACDHDTRDLYLSALDQLESDGFSHVVFHQNVGNRLSIIDSFEDAAPSYRDDFVWIYRLEDLRASCPR